MARSFGNYSPVVSTATTWEETFVLEDRFGTEIDITGFAVQAQLRAVEPTIDPLTNLPLTDPVLELTTPDFYTVAPAWPVFEAFSVPTPTDGTIQQYLATGDLRTANPANESKVKLLWEIVLVNPDTGYRIPVVDGKPTFRRAITL